MQLPFPKLKELFGKLTLVQKITFVIIFLGLVGGGMLYFYNFSRVKTVDCSKVPKVDNADVIRIEDGKFNPSDLTVKVCDTILFLNLDMADHWPKSSEFDAGHALPKFDYFQFQVTKTGNYSFNDYLHPELKGKITVKKSL